MPQTKWKSFFKKMILLIATQSKDPKTKVGCIITDNDNRIVSMGYNGYPNKCDDFTWEKNDNLDNKLLYVCHAEMNAILNSNTNVKNCKLYSTLFPCNECTKIIIQSGIKKVYYIDIKKDKKETKASKRMLKNVGIKYKKLT